MGEPAGFHAEHTSADQRIVDTVLDSMADLYDSIGQENSVAAGMVKALRERSADFDPVGEVLDDRHRGPDVSYK